MRPRRALPRSERLHDRKPSPRDLHHAVLGDPRVGGRPFAPQAIREVVKDSVYVLSGFEFTEYYFVISADRRELIAIDAGTRPDSARAA